MHKTGEIHLFVSNFCPGMSALSAYLSSSSLSGSSCKQFQRIKKEYKCIILKIVSQKFPLFINFKIFKLARFYHNFCFFFLLLVPLPVSLLLNAVWPEHKDITCIKLCFNKYQLNLCFQNLLLFLHSELVIFVFYQKKIIAQFQKRAKIV